MDNAWHQGLHRDQGHRLRHAQATFKHILILRTAKVVGHAKFFDERVIQRKGNTAQSDTNQNGALVFLHRFDQFGAHFLIIGLGQYGAEPIHGQGVVLSLIHI